MTDHSNEQLLDEIEETDQPETPIRRFLGFTKRTPKPKTQIRLTLLDTLATASLGPRGRPMRAVLSAIGISIGIASVVTVLGIPASFQAQLEADFEAWGANLVIVSPGYNRQTGEETPLPTTAPAMIERVWPVKAAWTIRYLPDANVYRTDKVPEAGSGGLSAVITQGDPFGTLTTTMAEGRWFDEVTSALPTVVLGENAARWLNVGVGARVWIAQQWWAVIGVLDSLPGFVAQLNSAAFLAPGWAMEQFDTPPISQILVNAWPGHLGDVESVMKVTANPANPGGVDVQKPTQYNYVAEQIFQVFALLALGLGGIALLVGGIGIANTMVVSVMERRGEIGLRRALGARTGQVAWQFMLEAIFIGLLGGVIGIVFGIYIVFCFTAAVNIHFRVPIWIMAAGPAISALVGVIAGLYPSLKAARQSPTVTLRAV
ncbi:MAG: ABC transporter permease [Propionibacteriaceae bacterium]|jgi:putative ABC transport system permease protein|nr:ABC transporter permease [Propionibacteriaceae bacterium]